MAARSPEQQIPVRSTAAARRQLSRHLAGAGIELGPGHVPFPIPAVGVSVTYVDRWRPNENRHLFPELGDEATFSEPDVVSDFDTDRLRSFADQSQDHVIASHMLEHVADPLGLLDDIHRVLRPGGVLILLLPDRRRTFDRDREPTPLSHLVDDHQRGVTSVDDDHIAEFLARTGSALPAEPDERKVAFDLHRRRSIHVHVWDPDEFFEVLVHAITEMGHTWEMVDALLAEDEGEWGCDFGWVLRPASRVDDPSVRAERLRSGWALWKEQRLAWHAELQELHRSVESAHAELDAFRCRLAELEARTRRARVGRVLTLVGEKLPRSQGAHRRGS